MKTNKKRKAEVSKIFSEIKSVITEKTGMVPFDEQLLAAEKLVNGNILEMYTGEGKSLVNVIAAITAIKLNNEINNVHIFTTNEYLATRDFEEFKDIFEAMNVSVGVLLEEYNLEEKREVYSKDIIYSASHTVGFDYLRQNIDNRNITFNNDYYKNTFAIIDEVDSILLDKGNTPLILSEGLNYHKDIHKVNTFVSNLKSEQHYIIQNNLVILTNEGVELLEKRLFLNDSLYSESNKNILKVVYNALNAHYKMFKDIDYIVEKDSIITIDAMTGRKLKAQKYSNGLQQAIEAKENVTVTSLTINNGMTTIQSHFKLYNDFGGLTGTSYTSRKEFKDIFNKKVVVIPRRLELQRDDETKSFLTKDEVYNELLQLVNSYKMLNHPILIGCQNIEESEIVSKLLRSNNFKINVLNAKTDKDEANMIAQAGKLGQITVATNIAGRGTDIKLENENVGLIVIGVGISISERIDNQLRGRSGRQGNPGHSYLLLSFEDKFITDNMDKDTLKKAKAIISKYAINNPSYYNEEFVFNYLYKVQKSYEDGMAESRKQVSYFDNLLNLQRVDFYNRKSDILSELDIESVDYLETEVNINKAFVSHLHYYDDIKKTINLMSYNGLDPKLEMQLLLNKNYKKIKGDLYE